MAAATLLESTPVDIDLEDLLATPAGRRVLSCIQCGICAGTCPYGDVMEHTPRKLINMLRAGLIGEVLSGDDLLNCVTCYACWAKCPRGIQLTDVLLPIVKEQVFLTGFRSDVANLLRCSDVVALVSQTESAPLTLLEGMSSGVPVVATSVGGIPEIVEDGVNGFLVEAKCPEKIAEKILALNLDKDLRSRLGEAARSTVLERYTAEKVVGQYLGLYEKIAKS